LHLIVREASFAGCINGGKWLAAKVLGEKPAQSAVNNNQHIATADIPVPSDFAIPCFGSFSEYLESLGHVPQQQCLALTMFVIWDKFEFVLAQIR
jgi:hypothetical protein